jgi:acetyl-CoA carboxylase beta subunit
MFERIKNFLTGKISDEDVNAHEWIFCPNCQVNIMKEDLDNNNWICPNCSTSIVREQKES